MTTREQVSLSVILNAVAEELDIPDSRYEEAVARYESVSKWLSASDSPLKKFEPDLYPQGSFRLGTVIKPVSDKDEYDIDLVCRLSIQKETVRQQQLKQMVGDRLKAHVTYRKLLEEKQRCWRLKYANEFHLDILPAIPDPLALYEPILVPDVRLDEGQWHPSNPKGYGTWFGRRMEIVFQKRRKDLAERIRLGIEAVPEWKVKTPLQRAVQILKRHRDIMFENDLDDKPASCIITTLAAHAYKNEEDLYEALLNVVDGMPLYIERRNGAPSVPNPAHSVEDFAEKWREHPQRAAKFQAWLQQVKHDLDATLLELDPSDMAASLAPMLGAGPVGRAQQRLDIPVKATSAVAPLIATRPRSFFNVSHKQVPTWQMALCERVSITAFVHKGRDGIKIQDIYPDRPKPLLKHRDLQYRASTTAKPPYEFYWQVVNTGAEAAAAGGLRGMIFKGEKIQWERTLYRGSHWIECFILRDNVCFARSGEFIINIT